MKKLISILFIFIVSTAFSAQRQFAQIAGDLNSPDSKVKIKAIGDLSRLGTDESQNALIKQVNVENNDYMKIQLIEALTVYRSTGSLEAVLSLINDPNPYVRQAVAVNLVYFPASERIAAELDKAISNDTNEDVKRGALNTLSVYVSTSAVHTIDKTLSNTKGDKRTRRHAAYVLGKINTKEAKDALNKHKNDGDVDVKSAVNKALNAK